MSISAHFKYYYSLDSAGKNIRDDRVTGFSRSTRKDISV